jgi:glycosyltransferase involved in cell wall biosynthesis
MPKVSVLVAVYNAEAFLPQCLDSLLRQTLKDIQVICIDDCSTDGSLKLLQDYAALDARIELIALPENGGQAYARNEGLKHAQGDYICMLDADDWFAPDALERAVAAFDEQTDCVLFDVVMWYDDQREELYQMPPFDVLTGTEAFRLSLDWQIHGLYMIRAAIHQQHPYDETCRLYSDDNTTRIHYICSRQVRRCEGRYYYRQHVGSATHRNTVRRFDYLTANESMRRQMQALNVSQEILDVYENHRWLNMIGVYMFYHVHGRELPSADREYGLSELHRIWGSIDRQALKKETIAKFGYRPCQSWRMFRLQEWLYFTLRGFLGKNR